jgi:hypothetical protein
LANHLCTKRIVLAQELNPEVSKVLFPFGSKHPPPKIKLLLTFWFISTTCFQCHRYGWNHEYVMPLMPQDDCLASKISWLILWYTFVRSKEIPNGFALFSVDSRKVCIAVSVDCFPWIHFGILLIQIYYYFLLQQRPAYYTQLFLGFLRRQITGVLVYNSVCHFFPFLWRGFIQANFNLSVVVVY